MRAVLILLAATTSAFFPASPAGAVGKVVTSPAEPDEHPDWADLGRKSSEAIVASLKNPEGAEVSWIQGFQWGSMKDVVGGRIHGWVACGYLVKTDSETKAVRKRQISVLAEPGGRIMFDYAGKSHSSCWTRAYVAPNQI